MSTPAKPFVLADVVESKIYTTREIAELFRVAPLTVCRWCRRGVLFAGKTPGGDYRIPGSEVLRAWGAMIASAPPTPERRPRKRVESGEEAGKR